MTAPTFPKSEPVDSPESVQAVWGLALQPAGCPNCKQVFLLLQTERVCPVCASASLVRQPALLRCEPPELVAQPAVSREKLAAIFTEFTRGVWLHTPDFDPAALLQRATPIYWPMWLVDADLSGDWQAEVGYDYQVKSSQEHYGSGGWQTTERVETRIRWEPRVGQMARHYDNVAVPALTGHKSLVELTGEYRVEKATPYDVQTIGQPALLTPDLHPENAWPTAKSRLEQAAGSECAQAAGAQHVRSYSIGAAYEQAHWTQLLLPMFASYYTDDDGKRHPVYVNAQTGKAGGLRLASQRAGWKWAGILGGLAAAALALAVLCFALGALFPPIMAAGALLGMLALVLGVGAIVPAVWPWQWNNRQVGARVSTK